MFVKDRHTVYLTAPNVSEETLHAAIKQFYEKLQLILPNLDTTYQLYYARTPTQEYRGYALLYCTAELAYQVAIGDLQHTYKKERVRQTVVKKVPKPLTFDVVDIRSSGGSWADIDDDYDEEEITEEAEVECDVIVNTFQKLQDFLTADCTVSAYRVRSEGNNCVLVSQSVPQRLNTVKLQQLASFFSNDKKNYMWKNKVITFPYVYTMDINNSDHTYQRTKCYIVFHPNTQDAFFAQPFLAFVTIDNELLKFKVDSNGSYPIYASELTLYNPPPSPVVKNSPNTLRKSSESNVKPSSPKSPYRSPHRRHVSKKKAKLPDADGFIPV